MDFGKLKSHLKQSVKKYSEKDFNFFMRLYESHENINEQIEEDEWCQVDVSVVQYYENSQESWLDISIYVSDDDFEIGSNIVFHRNGEIELPTKVFLHRFNGLPRPIADL